MHVYYNNWREMCADLSKERDELRQMLKDSVPAVHSGWTRKIKLSAKRGGNGYVSSYSVNIGVNEAKACGFILDGKPATLCKVIDSENGQIIIKLSKSADGGKDG